MNINDVSKPDRALGELIGDTLAHKFEPDFVTLHQQLTAANDARDRAAALLEEAQNNARRLQDDLDRAGARENQLQEELPTALESRAHHDGGAREGGGAAGEVSAVGDEDELGSGGVAASTTETETETQEVETPMRRRIYIAAAVVGALIFGLFITGNLPLKMSYTGGQQAATNPAPLPAATDPAVSPATTQTASDLDRVAMIEQKCGSGAANWLPSDHTAFNDPDDLFKMELGSGRICEQVAQAMNPVAPPTQFAYNNNGGNPEMGAGTMAPSMNNGTADGRCTVPDSVYVEQIGACVKHVANAAEVKQVVPDQINDPNCVGKPPGHKYDMDVVGPDGAPGVAHMVCGVRSQ